MCTPRTPLTNTRTSRHRLKQNTTATEPTGAWTDDGGLACSAMTEVCPASNSESGSAEEIGQLDVGTGGVLVRRRNTAHLATAPVMPWGNVQLFKPHHVEPEHHVAVLQNMPTSEALALGNGHLIWT